MAAKRFADFRYMHLDANENAFFERELETVAAETYDVLYPDLMARQILPSGSFDCDPGSELYTWRSFDKVGQAAHIANFGDDLPQVNIFGTENSTRIHPYGDGFNYTVQELKAAAKVGRPLDRDRAKAAREIFEQKIERIGALGDTTNGLYGLINQTSPVTYTVANNNAGTSKLWINKTASEISRDIGGICSAIISGSKGVEKPDTLVIPTAQHADISTRQLNDVNGETVLSFVLRSNPWIKSIVPWDYCVGAGAAATDRMVAFKKDPKKLKFVVAQEFETFTPEQRNLAFFVNGYGRTAGVVVHYPKSIAYGDGI
jgi:hypothetical protein